LTAIEGPQRSQHPGAARAPGYLTRVPERLDQGTDRHLTEVDEHRRDALSAERGSQEGGDPANLLAEPADQLVAVTHGQCRRPSPEGRRCLAPEKARLHERAAGLAWPRPPRAEGRGSFGEPRQGSVGVPRGPTRLGLDQPGQRQQAADLAAGRDGGSLPRAIEGPRHPGPREVYVGQTQQLGLADGPLEAEQEAVVEVRRVVEAVLIEDEGVGEGADLQQPVPVGRVAGEAGDLQPEHDTGAAHADVGDESLEAGTIGRGGA
jgi:hypothetical protein